MKTRSELREIAMKSMYQILVIKSAKEDFIVKDIIRENIEEENDFVDDLVNGTLKNEKDIIMLSNKYMQDWTIDRLNLVDQSIMELGIYELMYTDTPSIVAINEWVELSKKYSDPKVTNMINGVLDNIYHSEEKNAG